LPNRKVYQLSDGIEEQEDAFGKIEDSGDQNKLQ